MNSRPEDVPTSEPAPPAEAPRPETPGTVPTSSEEEDWATRYKYLLAEFENFRKRTEREGESVRLRARQAVLRDLLPVYESAERARESLDGLPSNDPVRRGVELIAREFRAFLKREGVHAVASVGQEFDPACHEAVGESAPAQEVADGRIGEVVQQGYTGPAGLLRPAKVIIARKPSPRPPEPGGEPETSPPSNPTESPEG